MAAIRQFRQVPRGHPVNVRTLTLGVGFRVRAPDGTIATIKPGPRGRGIRVSLQAVRVISARVLPRLNDLGLTGKGRPPTEAALVLRRTMLADRAKRFLKSDAEYQSLYVLAGGKTSAARQMVRRESARILAQRQRKEHPVSRGRPVSAITSRLRACLLADRAAMSEQGTSAYVDLLQSWGMTRKAGRNLLYVNEDACGRQPRFAPPSAPTPPDQVHDAGTASACSRGFGALGLPNELAALPARRLATLEGPRRVARVPLAHRIRNGNGPKEH